ASRFSVATGFVTDPASFLICASSLIAASARSSRWKGLSAAWAENAEIETIDTSTATTPARSNESIGDLPHPRIWGTPIHHRLISQPKGVEVVANARRSAGGRVKGDECGRHWAADSCATGASPWAVTRSGFLAEIADSGASGSVGNLLIILR